MDQATKEEPETSGSEKTFSADAIHLVRTAQLNTLTLSQMADQKANILIGATFVVFSLSVTRLLGSEITYATMALALTAFVSSMFAVLTVLPSAKPIGADDPNFNILFFGHFSRVCEDEWKAQMLEKFRDEQSVYEMMLRDIYQNGQILHRRKFRYLGYAYRSFLSGLFITIMIYLGEFMIGL